MSAQARLSFLIAIPAGFLLVFAAWAGLIYLQLGVPTETSRWANEINLKKQRTALAIKEPKLLVVGGSSTLFGLSAQEIQNQTGYPTVNLGTHLGLGTHYILHLAKLSARPGDTVLLVFEYEAYDYGSIGSNWPAEGLIDYIIARERDYALHLPLVEQLNLAMYIPFERLWRGLVNRFVEERRVDVGPVYNSDGINALGDEIANTRARKPLNAPLVANISEPLTHGMPEEPGGFPAIKAFCGWAKDHHIRVLATFPNIRRRPEYELPQALKTQQRIREFFFSMEVPVLGNPEDSMLPEDQFFDTFYHLTQDSAVARTQRLLKHLAPYLKPG